MRKTGPIIIIDDDIDDLEVYRHVLTSLNVKNKILLFNDANDFLKYMRENIINVFFILCDINMPLMDGFELRKELSRDVSLASRSIPFLFFSTSGNISHISKSYQYSIQGYFLKPSTFEEISVMFKCIVDYWEMSSHPIS